MWIGGAGVRSVVAVVSFVSVVGGSSVVKAPFVCGGEQAVCQSCLSGVGAAKVVLDVSCGCASVRDPVVGSCVGVVIVGRSSVGSRSCRL